MFAIGSFADDGLDITSFESLDQGRMTTDPATAVKIILRFEPLRSKYFRAEPPGS